MSHDRFWGKAPDPESFKKTGLKMLVVIVSRADGDKAIRFLAKQHFHLQFSLMARGTSGSELLDLLGFGAVDKSVIICIAPEPRVRELFPQVEKSLCLKKAGKGIAFTIPLLGVNMPRFLAEKAGASQKYMDLLDDWLANMENEVDKMNESIKHSVILAVVNQGYSEELVEAAKAVGAAGGTVINARRTGAEDIVKFFDMTVQSEKEIVAIVTSREKRQTIMEAIGESFGMNSPAHGVIISVPVDAIAGFEV